MADLEDIDGVGPATAEKLVEDGYETVEDVADGNAEDFDDLVPNTSGRELITNARSIVTEEESDTVDDDTYVFDNDLTEDQRNYLLRGLIDQETKARRVNNADKVNRIKGAIEEVVDGEPYHLTLEQLNDAYSGVNQVQQELLHDRNITSFVSEVREVTEYFDDAREELRSDE